MAAKLRSRGAEAWLALPEAASLFDPALLVGPDREQWTAIQTARRRRDWASSRALLSAVDVASDQRSSLAHTRGYAALALVPRTVRVGIDIEWMAPREFLGMAHVAYSTEECRLLASLEDPRDLCSAFYELWTLKEAFGKALRLPLVNALRQCRFVEAGLWGRAVVPTNRHWRATIFAPRPELRVAVALVADASATLDASLDTFEWPQPRRCEWTVIRTVAGGPGKRA